MPIPKFTDEQQNRLRGCGLCDEQIRQLRLVLLEIRRTIHKRAAHNDLKDVLSKVEKQSDALAHLLAEVALYVDAAHGEAGPIIEESYWREFPDDEGPTAMHHLIPRLTMLTKAARAGIEAVPPTPTRHRTADPTPIRRIDSALIYGWHRAHGSAKACPKEFRVSEAESTFREIVGICYEAAGAPIDTDPQRAIRAYMSVKRAEHSAALEVFDKALRESNRTSPKK